MIFQEDEVAELKRKKEIDFDEFLSLVLYDCSEAIDAFMKERCGNR